MKFKKNLSLIVLLITMSMFSVMTKVYASEVGKGICKLTFSISSNDNKFKDNITVYLKDIATDKEYEFVITPENYKSNKQYEIVANTTYNVKITFSNSNEFEIINLDNSKISSYHATESGLNLKWNVDKKNANGNDKVEDKNTKQNNNISNVGANEIFKVFQEKTKFIENDNNYKDFITVMSGKTYKESFLKIKANTEEKWDAMNKYQQACYSLIVIEPSSFILGINSNTYAKDNETFINNLDLQKNILDKFNNGDKVYKALVEVWNWHWNNWETKRIFINIYNEIDEDSLQPKSEISSKSDNVRSELTSKQTFFKLFKDNIITIILLIGVGIALYIVYKKNRENNYDDSEIE